MNANIHQHSPDLPPHILEQIFTSLSVLDRLSCNGVNRRWRAVLVDRFWNFEKLDREIVFKRAPGSRKKRFNSVQLTALFRYIGLNLRELDLHSFRTSPSSNRSGRDLFQPFSPQIAESLQFLQGLEILNIKSFDLALFVDYLPSTLRSLQVSEWFSVNTAETLSEKCPLLKEFSFEELRGLDVPAVGRRALSPVRGANNTPPNEGLEEDTFRAMAARCLCLQAFTFSARLLSTAALFQLAKMPSIVELRITFDRGSATFTDGVLKGIAKRGQLKVIKYFQPPGISFHKLVIDSVSELTDDSIAFLLENCKSLVTLSLIRSPNLTERSLRAVLAEVHRRHGNPPRELPSGPLDPGIFYFPLDSGVCPIDGEMKPNKYHPEIDKYFGPFLEIEEGSARDEAAENPWLTIDYNSNLEMRKFY